MSAETLRAKIREIPDFPKPGIRFKDFSPLLADGAAFGSAVAAMAAPWHGAGLQAAAATLRRRMGLGLAETYAAMDTAIGDHFAGTRFVTVGGALAARHLNGSSIEAPPAPPSTASTTSTTTRESARPASSTPTRPRSSG